MNYNEMVEYLKAHPNSIAHRPHWHYGATNFHIWYDPKYLGLMKTTCDWPARFYAKDHDEQASDWQVSDAPKPPHISENLCHGIRLFNCADIDKQIEAIREATKKATQSKEHARKFLIDAGIVQPTMTQQQIQQLAQEILNKHYNINEGFTNYERKCFISAMVEMYQRATENEEDKVIRVEVIDEKGRSYVNWDNRNKVELDYQDGGRTLKIFITKTSKTNTNQ